MSLSSTSNTEGELLILWVCLNDRSQRHEKAFQKAMQHSKGKRRWQKSTSTVSRLLLVQYAFSDGSNINTTVVATGAVSWRWTQLHKLTTNQRWLGIDDLGYLSIFQGKLIRSHRRAQSVLHHNKPTDTTKLRVSYQGIRLSFSFLHTMLEKNHDSQFQK